MEDKVSQNPFAALPALCPGHQKGWVCSSLVIPCQEIRRSSIIATESSSSLGCDLRIGVEISKYGGASESRFCYLNNVERVAWTSRWQACAKTCDIFAIDFAMRHLSSLFCRAASTLAVTLVLLFYFFNFFFLQLTMTSAVCLRSS